MPESMTACHASRTVTTTEECPSFRTRDPPMPEEAARGKRNRGVDGSRMDHSSSAGRYCGAHLQMPVWWNLPSYQQTAHQAFTVAASSGGEGTVVKIMRRDVVQERADLPSR